MDNLLDEITDFGQILTFSTVVLYMSTVDHVMVMLTNQSACKSMIVGSIGQCDCHMTNS